ncbi:ABC transporter permease [Microbacterium sp. dk485]|uniref:ABC transporter permease n=2 Tax=Microbacteriaceae TaxID=85023 RepID=A0ABX5SU80_9MICO|nr:ABC transporter permease [Microbacterium sp. EYE_512]QBR89748.1 ABC transporter permease [Microbacterium wangchenii]TFV85393.1 ABC transporter permease [Microbacterium sp. dk485]TXK16654.1 ABC transporter permease [Microbacterium wangchenii]
MIGMLGKRLLLVIPMVLVVSIIMFLLASLVPGDQARTILGENASPEAVAALRKQLGLDLPPIQQYFNWALNALQGDLGSSIYSGEPVTSILAGRLPVTLSLMVLSTLAIGVVGIVLGLASALRGGWLGRVLDAISLVGLAVPGFAIAIFAVSLLAVTVRIFPATGYVPLHVSLGGWLWTLVLPVFALSLGGTTLVAKQVRDSAKDALAKDYVRFLRANGVSETSIVLRHVLKNAAIPAVTVLGIGAIASLTGTVFVENVFVLPGLGTMATQATLNHDLPVLLGIGVLFTLITVFINLLVDIVYGVLNPKVRAA